MPKGSSKKKIVKWRVMALISATGTIECEVCGDTVSIELIEFIECMWGDDDCVELPDNWARENDEYFCGYCRAGVGL